MIEVNVVKNKWLTQPEFDKLKLLTNEYTISSVAELTKRSYNLVKGVSDSDSFEDYKASCRRETEKRKQPRAKAASDFMELSLMDKLTVIESKVDALNELVLAQNDKLNIKKGWLGK